MGFPDGFIWAAAWSNVLAEGAAARSDWYRWERSRDLEPSGAGIGLAVDADSGDFTRLAELGLWHVALTVEWARLEPYPGALDGDGLEHTVEVFTAARNAGLHPWAILHHGSLPGWFSEDGDGFRRVDGSPVQWSRHVDRVAELLDGLAVGWIPSVDPIGWAIDGHRLGRRPPGRRDEETVRDAIAGILDAVFDASRLLSSGDAPVSAWFGSGSADADLWIEAVRDGVLRLPGRSPIERPEFADAFDLIGVDVADPRQPDRLGEQVRRLGDALPDRELLICGLTVDTTDEPLRERMLAGWLDDTLEAIADGVPIRGVVFDPIADGYDMRLGRVAHRGLLDRDREPKPAFGWIEAQR